MPKRTDEDSQIESLTKGLLVLESLQDTAEDPVPIQTVIKRTGLSRDFCTRALKTFRLNGYSVQHISGKWMIGKRAVTLAKMLTKHLN